jgi:dTDP-4-dehydrorhamnose reductase
MQIAEIMNLDTKLVLKTEMSNIPWKARRPRDSSLDVTRARELLSQKPWSTREAIAQFRHERVVMDSVTEPAASIV